MRRYCIVTPRGGQSKAMPLADAVGWLASVSQSRTVNMLYAAGWRIISVGR